MARRLGTWLLGSAALSLGALGSLSGCYSHHTADEDKLDIDYPDASSYDAAVVVASDAGPAKADAGNCGTPGSIQSFLCGLTGGTGGTGATTGTGGRPATGTPSIADILNGTQDPAAFGDLLGALTGMGTSGGTSLTDLLAGLGIPTTGGRAPTMPTTPTTPTTPARPAGRDAGTGGRLGGFTTPTAADCANPTSALTQLVCGMQQTGRRDAGAARPTAPTTPPRAPATPPAAPTTPPAAPTTPPPAPAPVVDAAVAPATPPPATPVAPVEPTPATPPADVDAGTVI